MGFACYMHSTDSNVCRFKSITFASEENYESG